MNNAEGNAHGREQSEGRSQDKQHERDERLKRMNSP